jgi:hypothetical protein
MTANQPDKPPPLLLAVNIPSTGETIILHLTNAEQELPQHWAIGRSTDCAVVLKDTWVSAHHATIRAEPMQNGNNYDLWGRRRYVWMLRDNGSTNGLLQGGIRVGGHNQPCPWIMIEDNDSFFLGRTKIKLSFDGQFTEGGDTDSGTATEGPPDVITDIRPPSPSPTTIWDIVSFVLSGPKSTDNWLWWLFLSVVGSGVFLAVEWIKSR